jgi:uncharacterized cupin superfamily protein
VIAHFDDARTREIDIGHLRARWTFLGEAAGCVGVGVRRIEVAPDGWSTPAHEHGLEEEIFFVLGGSGVSWQNGETHEVRKGDCIVYLPQRGAHTLHAASEGLDVLAFGPRCNDESVGFPRLGLSLVGTRAVETVERVEDGYAIQFARESKLGPPELTEPSARPSTIVNLDDVEPAWRMGERREGWRDLGRAAGSVTTGLSWVRVGPEERATAPHVHSEEEEIFVVLEGSGAIELWPAPLLEQRGQARREDVELRAGHVVARPAGSGVAHALRGGREGMTYLAYGTRRPNDTAFYPRSNKIFFRGLGVIARVEHLDYWDGEER